ncbi:hypothetical protein L1987_80330 [Smallanthus sonchifolius]|uniref:Uncharacterized protein n=1 Tax=Smallanthus sonchifolius TaxID=185202 RepID=A0ACB8YLQ4_9ASTR|nr:hypothetical protein L1987_80330 [Smallanthus sonchifolius]
MEKDQHRKGGEKHRQYNQPEKRRVQTNLKSGGRSFRDALLNQIDSNTSKAVEAGGESDKWIIVPEEVVAFDWLGSKALVGRVMDLRTLNNLHFILKDCGFSEVGIRYLGGLYVLLSFQREESATELVSKEKEWGMWFSSLEGWRGQAVPFERIAWLKVLGVPFHLVAAPVLDLIGSRFGKVIHCPQMSSEDKDLSVLCIGILRGEGNIIRDSYTLVARNNKFKIWISEEEGAWTPDCSQLLSMTVTETVGSRDPVKEDEELEEGEFREVRMEVEDQEGDQHGEGGVQGNSFSVEPIFDTWYEGCSRDDNLHGDTNSTALKKSVKRNKFILGQAHKKKIQIKELERPRKRSRKEMEEDPFDLDYLLGLGQNLKGGGGMSSTSVEVHEASGEKGIDLNVRADSESQIDGEADRTGQNEGSESQDSGSNLGEPQTKKWRRKYRLRLKWE